VRRHSGALVIKISVRFNMLRKVHSWDGARRCTICDSVTVRSARRRMQKKEWLPRGSLITRHIFVRTVSQAFVRAKCMDRATLLKI
jgi:hypothetical protein